MATNCWLLCFFNKNTCFTGVSLSMCSEVLRITGCLLRFEKILKSRKGDHMKHCTFLHLWVPLDWGKDNCHVYSEEKANSLYSYATSKIQRSTVNCVLVLPVHNTDV